MTFRNTSIYLTRVAHNSETLINQQTWLFAHSFIWVATDPVSCSCHSSPFRSNQSSSEASCKVEANGRGEIRLLRDIRHNKVHCTRKWGLLENLKFASATTLKLRKVWYLRLPFNRKRWESIKSKLQSNLYQADTLYLPDSCQSPENVLSKIL